MKQLIYFLLSVLLAMSCTGQSKGTGNKTAGNQIVSESKTDAPVPTTEPEVETELIINPDYSFDESGELKLNTQRYSIRFLENIEDAGGLIAILDKQQNKAYSITGWATYYFNVYNNYLIIDEGTGNARTFYVFSLDSRKAVYKTNYNSGSEEFDPDKGILTFETKVDELPQGVKAEISEQQKAMLEENPSMFGYAEKRIFNLTTGKEEQTGTFRYQYYE